jgi:L-threonylcarbamoyladenylate synthase
MRIVQSLSKAAPLLRAGQVGVIPTDTVYGLAALASNAGAVQELYDLKAREHKPGTIVAANIEQLVTLGIPRRYLKAVEQFWPNSLSVVVPADANLQYLHQGKFSLALRVPADAALQQLLQETGPLLTSSANHPGQPPATTIKEAQAYFADTVPFYVDGGDLSGRQPSTIIRVVDDAIEVIREGAVRINEKGEII